MNKLDIYDIVEFEKTSDPLLDGKRAQVLGFYGERHNGPLGIIVQPQPEIEGYSPAMVFSPSCLKKV